VVRCRRLQPGISQGFGKLSTSHVMRTSFGVEGFGNFFEAAGSY
jgi:hypothetical protein